MRRNYRREVVIDGDDSTAEVARDALDILFDLLGYRGEEAIGARIRAHGALGCVLIGLVVEGRAGSIADRGPR